MMKVMDLGLVNEKRSPKCSVGCRGQLRIDLQERKSSIADIHRHVNFLKGRAFDQHVHQISCIDDSLLMPADQTIITQNNKKYLVKKPKYR